MSRFCPPSRQQMSLYFVIQLSDKKNIIILAPKYNWSHHQNCGLSAEKLSIIGDYEQFPTHWHPYKVSACWIHLIVGETNHGPRLLWNLPWRNKAEKVNFNCHEVMGLWMPSVHWWQPTGVNSMQAPWLFCASHTFCIVFRVGRWMHENDDIFLSGPEFLWFLFICHLFLRPMSDFQFHPVHSESFMWG